MNTINYDKNVRDLIHGLDLTGHVTHRSYKKRSVTIHHNAGRLSHEGVLHVWHDRPASAHFDVDARGEVAQYVRVTEYAWAVGNTQGNCETISIEMANSTLGPNWLVSETTWRSAARLAGWLFANIIGERPTSSNFWPHSHWSATGCPGPYVNKVLGQMLLEAQSWYDNFTSHHTPPAKPNQPTPPRKSNEQIASEVWAGKWGSGAERVGRLRSAGYDPNAIQRLVNQGVGRTGVPAPAPKPVNKSVAQLANEVIAGKWGNGSDRVVKLTKAGYDAKAVQAEVNRRLR